MIIFHWALHNDALLFGASAVTVKLLGGAYASGATQLGPRCGRGLDAGGVKTGSGSLILRSLSNVSIETRYLTVRVFAYRISRVAVFDHVLFRILTIRFLFRSGNFEFILRFVSSFLFSVHALNCHSIEVLFTYLLFVSFPIKCRSR